MAIACCAPLRCAGAPSAREDSSYGEEMTPLDWQDVALLNAVASHGTVRRAAAASGVHHSTVSRRIERFEKTLGAQVFDRLPEGLVLTTVGEQLVASARRFESELMELQRRVAGRERRLRGRVTLTVVEPVAVHAIGPRLAEFTERHPEIELTLFATQEFLDVSRREADVAVRMDNNPPLELVGKRLFPYHQSVYASIEYLRRHDPHEDPERCRWLGWEVGERFPDWTQETEFARAPVWGAFPNLGAQVAAAEAGLGLAMLPCFIADRRHELVRVARRPPSPGRDIWLLTHPDLRRTARVRAVMEFVERVLRDEEAAFLGELDR